MEDQDSPSPSSSSHFYACYLLTSLNPRFKGCHYIGFTVNPRRRIRQHNGELGQGAWRTHRKRPWEMVLCVYGFSSQVFHQFLQIRMDTLNPGSLHIFHGSPPSAKEEQLNDLLS
jgi:hypothetical protein